MVIHNLGTHINIIILCIYLCPLTVIKSQDHNEDKSDCDHYNIKNNNKNALKILLKPNGHLDTFSRSGLNVPRNLFGSRISLRTPISGDIFATQQRRGFSPWRGKRSDEQHTLYELSKTSGLVNNLVDNRSGRDVRLALLFGDTDDHVHTAEGTDMAVSRVKRDSEYSRGIGDSPEGGAYVYAENNGNKRAFTPWAGKRDGSRTNENEEKRAFTPWAGKRNDGSDDIYEVVDEDKRGFTPWAGKRYGTLNERTDDEKRAFNPWSGKRTSPVAVEMRAFQPWAGKRAFNAWAGKRGLDEASPRSRYTRAFQPWAGKRGSDSWLEAEDPSSESGGKMPIERRAFQPRAGKRAFNPWSGKKRALEELLAKRAFQPWAGKRAFQPWAGKRNEGGSTYNDDELTNKHTR